MNWTGTEPFRIELWDAHETWMESWSVCSLSETYFVASCYWLYCFVGFDGSTFSLSLNPSAQSCSARERHQTDSRLESESVWGLNCFMLFFCRLLRNESNISEERILLVTQPVKSSRAWQLWRNKLFLSLRRRDCCHSVVIRYKKMLLCCVLV